MASLEEVVARMKPGQKDLYFVATLTKEQAQNSPFVEKLAKKDLEVPLVLPPLGHASRGGMLDFQVLGRKGS